MNTNYYSRAAAADEGGLLSVEANQALNMSAVQSRRQACFY